MCFGGPVRDWVNWVNAKFGTSAVRPRTRSARRVNRVIHADPVQPSQTRGLSLDWVNWVDLGQHGSCPSQEQLGQRVTAYITRTLDPVCGPLARMGKRP
jgi:hypothetical protein